MPAESSVDIAPSADCAVRQGPASLQLDECPPPVTSAPLVIQVDKKDSSRTKLRQRLQDLKEALMGRKRKWKLPVSSSVSLKKNNTPNPHIALRPVRGYCNYHWMGPDSLNSSILLAQCQRQLISHTFGEPAPRYNTLLTRGATPRGTVECAVASYPLIKPARNPLVSRSKPPFSAMEHVTKEKHVVNADGSEHHEVRSELKDGRSFGDKIEDAKAAFKSDGKEQQITKEKVEIKDGKSVHEVTKEVKDPRSLGEKIGDAKDAFAGKH
ncbi:hypothetical protein BV898_01496 [Hypsibius exemplaris]|uniref:Uncharacterized protein n=1 Tax=Hypsibius exemplaris TaxID=2072580 RepID=A0A1W0XAT7_HYPEX|nr:hypothetical protein BV898_01496 [Hypsibius exemplaris]